MLVYDLRRNAVVVTWRGELARRLLASDIVRRRPEGAAGMGPCDKRFVEELTLAATRIQMERHDEPERRRESTMLRRRIAALGLRLPAPHSRIADIMYQRPGQHLSNEDLICLAQLAFPCIDAEQVVSLLDELVRWRLVQRIEVDAGNVFYDIDTRPHLHVFCPRSRELHDAPGNGVVCASY